MWRQPLIRAAFCISEPAKGATPCHDPPMSGRYVACIHEAGHALAAVQLGIPFSYIEVDDDGGGNIHTLRYRGRRGSRIVFLIAGPAAEAKHCRRDLAELFRECCSSDWRAVRRIVDTDPTLDLDSLSRQARRLVSWQWAMIETLAEALDHGTMLSHASLVRIINRLAETI